MFGVIIYWFVYLYGMTVSDNAIKTLMVRLSTEATLMAQAARSDRLTNASYLCQPCQHQWLNRPHFDTLGGLVSAWNDLHVCLPAGKMLIWLTDRISTWQAKTCSELTVPREQSTRNKNTGGWSELYLLCEICAFSAKCCNCIANFGCYNVIDCSLLFHVCIVTKWLKLGSHSF